MRQARHQAGLQLCAFHLVAQHLDQHQFEQSGQHFAAAATLFERFLEQQVQQRAGADQLLQWQAEIGR